MFYEAMVNNAFKSDIIGGKFNSGAHIPGTIQNLSIHIYTEQLKMISFHFLNVLVFSFVISENVQEPKKKKQKKFYMYANVIEAAYVQYHYQWHPRKERNCRGRNT